MSNDIESTTQQDTTYAVLRQWVTVGRFLPGERLKIRNVAAEMGVGQMPVRAALQRLAAEGALVNVPNAGMIVPRLTLPEFDDLLQMRMLLEGEAAERGCLRLEPAELARLRKLCKRMAKALKTPTAQPPRARAPDGGKQTLTQSAVSLKADQVTDYLAANEDFHVLIYKAAGSPLLFDLIDTLWLKAGPISNCLFHTSEAWAVLNDAHEDLMEALDRRDAAAARRAVERDIFVAGQFMKSTLKRD